MNEQFLAVLTDQLAHCATLSEGPHPPIGQDERWEQGYAAGRATLARELQDLVATYFPQTGLSNEQVAGELTKAMLGAQVFTDPAYTEQVRLCTEANLELAFLLRRHGLVGIKIPAGAEQAHRAVEAVLQLVAPLSPQQEQEWRQMTLPLAEQGILRAP